MTAPARLADPYGRALREMARVDHAVLTRAGDYLVAFLDEPAEGRYEPDGDGLVWREAAPDATTHLEVAVADANDGRFVPGLRVHVAVQREGRTYASGALDFRWHPFLYHYGANVRLPGSGPYDVTVRIAAPDFLRHDQVNGRRYAAAVTVRFEGVRFACGRHAVTPA